MSALALQTAIYTALQASSYNVYDDVPVDAEAPYIVIGDDTLINDNADDFEGFDATVTIHTWSEYRGRAEIKTMQYSIYELLNHTDMTVVGYNLINIYQEFSESMLDPDGITRHGVQRFRVLFNES